MMLWLMLGTGSARTITHNLGVVPEFMIAKKPHRESAVGYL